MFVMVFICFKYCHESATNNWSIFENYSSCHKQKTCKIIDFAGCILRRVRDSNPRTCYSQQFSRLPQSTTLPTLPKPRLYRCFQWCKYIKNYNKSTNKKTNKILYIGLSGSIIFIDGPNWNFQPSFWSFSASFFQFKAL